MGKYLSLLPATSSEVFEERRQRLVQSWKAVRGGGAFVLASGWARPRNFAHNVYPFRAESHFLCLVGQQLEGAILAYDKEEFFVCMAEPEPELSLWDGPTSSLEELERGLGMPVRPYSALSSLREVAVLPPQDDETALWLEDLLGREVTPQGGTQLQGADAALADAMIELRLHHDDAALRQMQSAAWGTAEAHVIGMQATRGASHETTIRGAMVGALVARGLTPGYTPIVTTSGEVLHAPRSEGRLDPGDLLLCDVGGETPEGFTADITRTWPVNGRFSATQKAAYEAVLHVQKEIIAKVRPGASYLELHRRSVLSLGEALVDLGLLRGNVEDLLQLGAISLFYPHGLGHLLGIDVHDMEDLGDRAGYAPGTERSDHPAFSALRLNRTLQPGMCVTIEPGFYQIPLLQERARTDERLRSLVDWERLETFADVRGIRIEDDVVVTEGEPEILSRGAPKEVEEIEAILA